MNASEVQHKKFSILGAAKSGIAVAKLLKSQGAEVFVSEKQSGENLGETKAELERLGVRYEFGGHSDQVLNADILVVSPGVPSDVPVVKKAKERGGKVFSELEVASWFCKAPIVAVTGSNGKTTTTTLLGRMFYDAQTGPFRSKKKYVVAGNIGDAFSNYVLELDQTSTAIVEVSSFQLDHIEKFHPKIAIILNITPDHLDRYERSLEKYVAAKCRIFENQTIGDFLIYNFDDEVTKAQVHKLAKSKVHTLPFSVREKFSEGAFVENGKLMTAFNGKCQEIIAADQISIRGTHNIYNSMVATLAAQLTGIPVASIRATLKNFKGVEHRLEFVREVNGVKYVNDSKATNVHSVWYALLSFEEPIIALIGGRDKGNDYSMLFDVVKKKVKAIVAIGESAEKVEHEFHGKTKVIKAHSMEEAVKLASTLANSGDVVLLSPACASFDWFKNFEHRGEVFKELVNKL